MVSNLSDADAEKIASAIAPKLAEALTSRLKTTVTFGDAGLLSPAEAADLIKMSMSTLEAWRSKGLGPKWVKIGTRSVGYPIAELKKYLARGDAPTVAAE
jgi:predicted DNA-binding transcriptional regulator AlpA